MINKTLSIAQTLGDHIAEGKLPSRDKLSGESDYIYLQLKPLKDIEQAIALWQGLLRNFVNIKQPIDLIVTGNKSVIQLVIGIPAGLQQYVENIYFANFATSDLQIINYTPPTQKTYVSFGEEDIVTDTDFIKNGQYMDPFKDVLSLYDMIGSDERMDLVYRCMFKKPSSVFTKAWKFAKKLVTPENPSLTTPDSKSVFDGQDANQQVEMKLSYSYVTSSSTTKDKLATTIKSVYLKYLKSGSIKLKSSVKYRQLWLNQFVNFYHFMTKDFVIPNLEYATYRKLPAPTNIPTLNSVDNKNDLTVLGYTDYKSDTKMFGVKREDKLRHMYIIGQTGTGKSKFIANMVRSDMISNKGVCVIDPHGDLIDDILSQVPSYRTNDVMLFDVADREFPVGFNVFEFEKPEEKPLIASGIVGIFKKMFGNSWGPRLEYILRNVILSLLEYPNATFLDLVRMLTDENYKEEVLEYVKDPIILRFWRDEYDKYQPKQREEAIAPITNKVGQFTSSTIVRNIFGQSKTKLNFRRMMDESKIILVNLSKGKVGEDSMAMIGSFIASKIQIDAMSRADIDESQRKDFYLYIDEFQNFATESFATILSEARKYKLALIMANQYISQLDEVVRNAIFGNVGTIICNRIGKDDAEIMSHQFKSIASANDFLSLPNRRCYIKLMINGMVSDPFSMKTADFVKYENFEEVKAKVREQSRQRYAMPRLELEALMKAWAEKKFTMAEKVMEKAKAEAKAAKERLTAQQTPTSSVAEPVKSIDVPVVPQDSTTEQISSPSSVSEPVVPTVIMAPESSIQEPKEVKKPREQVPTDYQTNWTPDLSGLSGGKSEQKIEDKVDESIEPKIDESIEQNIVDVESTQSKPLEPISTGGATSDSEDFTVNDLVIGNEYSGYVKLKYNYGLFVTVYGVEGLLHKNFILAPEGVSWKKLYEIGDPITVKAMEFKEIEGEKRVVWTQL